MLPSRLKKQIFSLFIGLLLGVYQLFAQNLVPNPDFSNYSLCPGGRGLIGRAIPWYSPNRNTSDFCHSCSGSLSYSGVPANRWGNQFPFVGDGYGGIRTWISRDIFAAGENYREYLAVKLIDTLIAGETYFLSFRVSMGDKAGYFSDDLGMYLSQDSIASETLLTFSPQLENSEGNILSNIDGWVEISREYVAEGGEQFLAIGNFKNDEETTLIPRMSHDSLFQSTYYFIDDVKVELCKTKFPENMIFASDSLICEGEVLRLAAIGLDSATYLWEDGSTKPVREIYNANTYRLRVNVKGCTHQDSIVINQIDFPEIELGRDTVLCEGERLVLDAGPGADSYLWSDQSTDAALLVSSPGTYRVQVARGKCVESDQIDVRFEEVKDRPEDQMLEKCEDTEITLAPSVKGLSYLWQGFETEATYTANSAGSYYVDISSYCFEVRQVFTVTEIVCSCESIVPNVFSPNGDGINDNFIPQLVAPPENYRLEVFDRHGRPVFSSQSLENGWNGNLKTQMAPEGVYYWVLHYVCLEAGQNQQKIKQGYVSLLR